jgi:hypothetical protein
MKTLTLGLGLVSTIIFTSATFPAVANINYNFDSTSSQNTSELLLAEAVKGGNFTSVEHPTQGKVSIVEENGTRYLELSSDFQTDEGPDLKVILHNANSVDLKVKEGDYLSLGALQQFNGTQRYAIPDDVDLEEYKSVAIWCQQFNATFGYAPLTAAK